MLRERKERAGLLVYIVALRDIFILFVWFPDYHGQLSLLVGGQGKGLVYDWL
jgi:hypothetical protein